MAGPSRGEIWSVDLDPVRGHVQAGTRPALVVSVDEFNEGPADLVVVLPITTKEKGIPFHLRLDPPEGGLKATSFIKCEDVRSVSKERLVRRFGKVSPRAIADVEFRLRVLLKL
jgi:mRNA interferase MazF